VIHRVLILGHTGFIGTHLTAHLQRARADVEIIGRAPASLDLTNRENVQALSGLLDPETAVVMLAATKRQFGDSLDNYLRNVQMVANLCQLLVDQPVGRLIYFSSAAVYGEDIHNRAITEDTAVNPRTYYGVAKFASECLLRKTFESRASDSLLVLRPPLVYGPGDQGDTYGPSGFVRSVIRGRDVTLWGDGEELREFLCIGDLVRLVDRVISSDVGGVLNCAAGVSHSFRDALDVAISFATAPVQVGTKPRTKAAVDNVFLPRRLREVLPDFSFTSLEEGMRQVYDTDMVALR
jgi:UDP-glucose 4-epimerase